MRYMTLNLSNKPEGRKIVVNIDHITSFEHRRSCDDTIITMANRDTHCVKESVNRLISMIDSHRY